ncbi:MAG: TraB/GumN family protein [Oscillospiraceae bacterium]|nr:TraB/GumN family protein [Oscillospiraceae bacterium]
MNKKAFILAAILLFSLLLGGCEFFSEKYEPKPVSPPFFTVRDESTGGVVYMLGTMHAAENGVEYPEEIYKAIDECSIVAVEVDLIALDQNKSAVNEAMKLLECKTGITADILGDDYSEIKRFFAEKGIYNTAFDRYLPVFWSAQLSNKIASDCGYYSENGTDRAVIKYAMKNNKDIFEFESIYEQYKMNSMESPALQAFALKDAVNTPYDEQLSMMRELYRAWSEGDTDALEKLLEGDEIPEELGGDYDEYYAAMYTDRQRKMAERISEWLAEGKKVFVAVGAMHFVAEPDILDFLGQRN